MKALNPRHQFLLFSHLFPFSGIASSLLVGQFWSAFAESWPNVDKSDAGLEKLFKEIDYECVVSS